uniref:DAGKc domain-containing protein n=2 Tax=Physcomitrium patens TaxID=3218 RepID=A0A7I4BN80_PHYPA
MRAPWVKLGALSRKINPLGTSNQNQVVVDITRNSHENSNGHGLGAHSVPVALGETSTRSPGWSFRRHKQNGSRSPSSCGSAGTNGSSSLKCKEVRIDVGVDEGSDLLGEIAMLGNLTPLITGLSSRLAPPGEVSARLTTKTFYWGLRHIQLDDIVAVSCHNGSERFTIHSYPLMHTRWVPSCLGEHRRRRNDLHFAAPSQEEAANWVNAFANYCHVNFNKLPAKEQKGASVKEEVVMKVPIKCKPGPVMLVVLNPRSGKGKASKVFRTKVLPILELAGCTLTVVETTHARHAQELAASINLTECADGIVCVGGDGILNEVLNGLLSRDDAEAARAIPLGIIPAGSDNSLVWTVFGIRDPTAAAVAIVKGGTITTDVIGVECHKTDDVHLGLTVAYYGFMSDVLELSAKYQRRCGPLRYFVAGFLRLLCLSHYQCEVHYLPVPPDLESVHVDHVVKSVDSVAQETGSLVMCPGLTMPNRLNGDSVGGIVEANMEPSDYIRGLSDKEKCNSYCRMYPAEDAVTVNTATPASWARTRSKTRSRSFGLNAMGPESVSRPVQTARHVSTDGSLDNEGYGAKTRRWFLDEEDKWESRSGTYLGVIMCNHECKTVQCMKTQSLAPRAEHDDGVVHLLLVRNVGRLQLMRFFLLMQFGRHLSLPFVEYSKLLEPIIAAALMVSY